MLTKNLMVDLLRNKKVILKISVLDIPFEVGEFVDIRQEIIDKIDIFSCQILQNNILIGEEYKYLVKHRSSIKKNSLYRFMGLLYKEFRFY